MAKYWLINDRAHGGIGAGRKVASNIFSNHCPPMKNPHRIIVLFLAAALTGCASLDKYSFETFVKPPAGDRRIAAADWPARSDARALLYADYQARLLEGRGTGARVTRELSDSSLAIGGALAGGQEALGIAASSVAAMGVGLVITRELQGIFNARGRSEAFVDAAYLIRQAQNEYRQYNPNPSGDRLTENGAILISRVDAAMHAVLKSLNGRLPGLLDLQQATQPMTKAGANRGSSGTPQTIFTAAGNKPAQTTPETVTPAQLQAAVDRAVLKFNRRTEGRGGESKIRSLTPTAFRNDVEALMGKLNSLTTDDQVKAAYKGFFGQAPTKSIEEQRQEIYDALNALKNASPGDDGMMKPMDMDELTKFKNALP